ncbi:uncharacterized protein EURHEDRAFT_384420 [Aspergillus ruber CBS 135680]|uniref:Major facilitator superfamily (MFS) profile domain-containing protein n=1 Tax=Aspergillus ruber (strain CBS 135680) TaxID=1388766 RepID=A0A017SMW9_ASPRC|nr:uncharacterized protein EURHEDRAFT_384420 [Aspergillus ruber CBS 135680]EYE97590.1 hypothetical protein EURHEDRAFT_384420 [Aspergillus ruber CBS 135680]
MDVPEIFLNEIRPIGMGFSLFGHYPHSAPDRVHGLQQNVGWKYCFVIICWSAFFIPVIYFFFPETARLISEEIAKNFGEEVAVHITDATDAERAEVWSTSHPATSDVSLRRKRGRNGEGDRSAKG